MPYRIRAIVARATTGISVGALLLLLSPAASAETVRIEIKSYAFVPAQAKARVGDTVEWTNRDAVTHTVTANRGEWNFELAPNTSRSVVVNKPGPVPYHCNIHPYMAGSLTVQ